MAEVGAESTESNASAATDSGDAFDQAFNKAAAGEGEAEGDSADEGTDDGHTDEHTDSDDETTPEHTQEETRAAEASTKGNDDTKAVSDADVRAMLDKLPPELSKAWEKHFTQRSQKVAAQEKFLAAFEKDPVAAARSVLAQLGEEDGETDGGKQKPAPVNAETIKAELSKAVPKEALPLVEAFVPAIEKLLNAAITPISENQKQIALANTAERVDSEIESFKKDYPDYDELEPKMEEWMDKIQPTDSMSTREFLTVLRTLALGPKATAEKVQKVVKKMAANAASQTAKAAGVPAASVKPGPSGKLLSFDEAADMASRGEVVGKGISR